MTETQERELKRLRDAFTTADKNDDDLLNSDEFMEFVEIAYHKQCPPQMYQTICARFKRDVLLGIDWNTAKTIYVQANNHPKAPSESVTQSGAAMAQEAQKKTKRYSKTNSSSNHSDSSHFIRQHSITMSQSSVISELEADTAKPLRLQRASTMSSTGLHRKSTNSLSFEANVCVGDTSSMIVDILDHKNKSLQNKLSKERTKRKKTEEIAQSLLKQNEEYRGAMERLENVSCALRAQNKTLNAKVVRLERTVDEEKNSIKYLHEKEKSMQCEVDEAYNLWTKMEKKLKQKHAAEMSKLYSGLVESIPSTTVIATLKNNNIELKNTVDTLAESLARKQQSLIEALQAVDNIASNDEKTHQQLEQIKLQSNENEEGKIRKTLKQWNQRRKSIKISRKLSIRRKASSDDEVSRSVDGSTASDMMNAAFFKRVNAAAENKADEELNVDNAKNVVEMHFLSQQLSRDVANKTQSIENLEMANTVLFEQMAKMKQQMHQMKELKQVYDSNK
eukprot:124521_1